MFAINFVSINVGGYIIIPNFDPPPHQQPSAIHKHPLPLHQQYLNEKAHNILVGTTTPLTTKDLIHTSNNSKKKKIGKILSIFC